MQGNMSHGDAGKALSMSRKIQKNSVSSSTVVTEPGPIYFTPGGMHRLFSGS